MKGARRSFLETLRADPDHLSWRQKVLMAAALGTALGLAQLLAFVLILWWA